MRRPCRMAGGKRPCFPPCRCKRLKAEFGYDDRKGVGACDRGPSGLGDDVGWKRRRRGPWRCLRLLTQRRSVCFLGIKDVGYDDRKGVGACDRGPSGLSSSSLARDAVSHKRDVFTKADQQTP